MEQLSALLLDVLLALVTIDCGIVIFDNFWPIEEMSDEARANKERADKDREEVAEKTAMYGSLREWKDKGIIHEFKETFGVENPTKDDLLALAQIVSKHTSIVLDRQDKRRKNILIGWFNSNWEQIRPLLSRVVVINKNETRGERKDAWMKIVKNPSTANEKELVAFLKESNYIN